MIIFLIHGSFELLAPSATNLEGIFTIDLSFLLRHVNNPER
jgi:hypothetical protein